MKKISPPRPKKIKKNIELHGDIRVDNYYWLRDDTRKKAMLLIISRLKMLIQLLV